MDHEFDRGYWESHWEQASGRTPAPAHPYLERELAGLAPGTALDAGCGEGAEALWLAAHGWRVTAVDVSAEVLARASARGAQGGADGIDWVRADLTTWAPPVEHDLVTTHYAHPAMPQLGFYARVAEWVAPGGTLLVVGHRAGDHGRHGAPSHLDDLSHHGHGHHRAHGAHPDHASATAAEVVALLDPARWDVVTSDEPTRRVERPGGDAELHDVVVRAVRRP